MQRLVLLHCTLVEKSKQTKKVKLATTSSSSTCTVNCKQFIPRIERNQEIMGVTMSTQISIKTRGINEVCGILTRSLLKMLSRDIKGSVIKKKSRRFHVSSEGKVESHQVAPRQRQLYLSTIHVNLRHHL